MREHFAYKRSQPLKDVYVSILFFLQKMSKCLYKGIIISCIDIQLPYRVLVTNVGWETEDGVVSH